MSAEVTLVLGGARSGKSRHAEGLVTAAPPPWIYLATAEALDEEMRARIRLHRAQRAPGWTTVEEPLDLPGTLRRHGGEDACVLVDCLTLWVSNLMGAGRDVGAATADLLAALDAVDGRVVMVANEVGLGIVPDNPLARAFRDAAGRLNQAVAARAERVLFLVAGLPITVK
ncbi:bifunctional adenosylcobinamide kinase/adenosylcobinamide-phosphate guanylyltransferase [Azospirillum sp. ST 5-10]|uniref:bifunctional adenosylcobinamide kinase/adenosylcobinamide-phosphate guanylyltransferase n=1 Tax=unclassified Azospirillum TaxID=2630922 RepID=UPI003F49DE03